MESGMTLRKRNDPRIEALTDDQAVAVYTSMAGAPMLLAALRALGLEDRTALWEGEVRAVLHQLSRTAFLTRRLDALEAAA